MISGFQGIPGGVHRKVRPHTVDFSVFCFVYPIAPASKSAGLTGLGG
jgi:hypothetical protein